VKRICIITILLHCLVAFAQTNNERNVLEEFGKSRPGVVSRNENMAIVYQPFPAIYHQLHAIYQPFPGKTPDAQLTQFNSSDPIYVRFVSTTNKPSLLFMLRPQYEFRFSAVSENGEDVEVTHLGAKYGRYFDDLKSVDNDAIAMNNRRTFMRSIADVYGSDIDLGTAMLTPDELFRFKKPGKYTMTVEAACFASRDFPPKLGSIKTNYYLVKFPPVKLQIIKEEAKDVADPYGVARIVMLTALCLLVLVRIALFVRKTKLK
jgi:hypothetical protein